MNCSIIKRLSKIILCDSVLCVKQLNQAVSYETVFYVTVVLNFFLMECKNKNTL